MSATSLSGYWMHIAGFDSRCEFNGNVYNKFETEKIELPVADDFLSLTLIHDFRNSKGHREHYKTARFPNRSAK